MTLGYDPNSGLGFTARLRAHNKKSSCFKARAAKSIDYSNVEKPDNLFI
jgi:hypothetical protein